MIRAVLVDNEKPLLDELDYLLGKHDSIDVLAMFTDPVEALRNIGSLSPDVVFLDIDMPVLNGMNLAREIKEINPNIAVVFVTAFDHFAIQAFELNAIDYLLKPIRKDRLASTIEKLCLQRGSAAQHPGVSSETLTTLANETHRGPERIVVFDGEEYHMLFAEDILHIEAQRKDTLIITEQIAYRTRKSLDQWDTQLKPHGFFRCHRSFVVNLKHVTKLSPMFNNNYVISQRGTAASIPVSKNNVSDLKTLLNI